MSERLNHSGEVSKRVEGSNTHVLVIWNMAQDETGEPMEETVGFVTAMVQVHGEMAGAEVEWLGEILPGRWDVLTDYDSLPLKLSSPGQKSTNDRVLRIKPRVVGGSELTQLEVGLLLVR